MKVLMISLDRSLFDPSSPSASRMRAYGEAAGSLTVAVLGFRGREAACGKVRAVALTPWRLFAAVFFPWKADLVTAQDPFWTGLAAFILARRCRARLEIQLHGDPWSGGKNGWALGWVLWMIRRADGVRVVGERLRQRLVAAGIFQDRIFKIPILPVGRQVGLDRFEPAPRFFRPPGFETVFVFVGRLDKGKGVDLLIDAFAAAQLKNSKIALLIVGDGPERAALESRARGLDLRTPVRFLGWMRDPRGVIAAADALVLPSWSEGWGRSPVEALAAGVPVIMTDVGLAGEVVKHEENGLVVSTGNTAALQEVLERFVDNPELRARLRLGARESARALPSFGKTVSDVVAAWKTACSRPPVEPPTPHHEPPSRRAVIAVFLLALAARLIMFAAINVRGGEELFFKYSDGNEYLVVARNLLGGHGFSVSTSPPYLPYEYYTPGYPLLLAGLLALGLGVRTAVLLQVVVGAATAALVAMGGWRIFGRRAAILAGVLLALEPSTIFWNNQLVTETLSTFFLLGAFFSLAEGLHSPRPRFFTSSGILLGLSVLVRHAAQFLVWIFPLAVLLLGRELWRRRLAGAVLCGACTLVLISPWIIRNRVQFGLWLYSDAGSAVGLGKTLQHYSLITYGKSVYELYPSSVLVKTETQLDLIRENIRTTQNLWHAGFSILRNDPIGLARVYLKSFLPFFFGDGYTQIRTVVAGSDVPEVRFDHSNTSLWSTVIQRPDAVPFMIGKSIWGVITLLALVGVVSRFRVREVRPAVILAILLVFYYAVGAGVGGYSRFRFPVTPLILLFSGAGVVSLRELARRSRNTPEGRIIIVTQTVDLDHPVLGFFHRWIEELATRFQAVEVVALRAGRHALPANVRVSAPRPRQKFLRNVSFLWLLARRIPASDGVFFHMCPEYAIAAAPLTVLFRKRTLLWYTHRSVTFRLRLATRIVGRVFTAAPESCRIRSSKVEAVGHGVDVPERTPPVPSADFRILVVGRLAPVKEIGTVIDAVSLLRKRGLPATVTILGGPVYPADEAYAAALRSRVDALGLGPYTRFAGPMRHQDVLSAYRSADVLVNASPNGPDKVVYEAAAAGVPVVAAHPAFRPLFGTRASDLAFPVLDAPALADRLARLAALGPDKREEIGVDLRTAVIKDYSLSKLTDHIARYLIE